MSDTCKHCMIRGNIVACRATPCHTHESWYAQQQNAEIERLKEALQKFLDNSSVQTNYPDECEFAEAALNTEDKK